MNSLWTAIVLSMIPIAELRGGIPVALCARIPWLTAFIVCVLANSAVIIPGFLFLEYINRYFLRIPSYKRFFERNVERARKRQSPQLTNTAISGLLFLSESRSRLQGHTQAPLLPGFLEWTKRRHSLQLHWVF